MSTDPKEGPPTSTLEEILSPNPDPDGMSTDPKEGLPTSPLEEELFCEMLF